ncbi:hypothetical protein MPSEU_000655900 [Mayamaea pseudoterrestris]|nr:hypothetical protein MPSEU_000655900 [Mayamaea pseudoterrestris]
MGVDKRPRSSDDEIDGSSRQQKRPHVTSVGFIGSGMMATAIMDALVEKGIVKSESIACSDVWEAVLGKARGKGYFATLSNHEVCERARDVIIIAVKPNVVQDACNDIMQVQESSDALIISVAAGVTLATLEQLLPGRRVVRLMPNTCCVVGEAASGYALGALANNQDCAIVQTIFGSCGLVRELSEFLLNAVTGLSGSGPAFVFEFIEAMADGGVRCGLPRGEAIMLAAQTVKGAAEMVLTQKVHPAELKDRVTSPGGTTIAGCDELEKG